VTVLRGSAGGLGPPQSFGTDRVARRLAAGDLDGDGFTDLASSDIFDDVNILWGTGSGVFERRQIHAAGQDPAEIVVGDFNGDGNLDMASPSGGGSELSVHLGDGAGSFSPGSFFLTGGNPRSITAGDFDDDGILDLITADQSSRSLSVLLGNGDGTFPLPQTISFGATGSPHALEAGDLNGDGALDLVVTFFAQNDAGVLLGNHDGSFQPPQLLPMGGAGKKPLLLDLSGDGLLDLVIPNDFTNTLGLRLGNGDGSFQALALLTVGDNTQHVLATRTRSWLRLRLTLLYLARVVACAGVGALALYLSFGAEAPLWAEGLAVCCLSGVISGLSAAEARMPQGNPIPSNGLALRRLSWNGGEGLAEYSAGSYAYQARDLLERGRSSEASTLLEEGLVKHPGHTELRISRGYVHLECGEDLQAKEIFEEILATPELISLDRLTLLNDIAWADLSLGQEYLEEAARYSEEVCRSIPDSHGAQNTRAAVLIRLGRVEEGMALLQKISTLRHRPREQAYDACWLAVGSALLGRPEEARRYLEKAQQLDPRCPHLGMVTREVAAAEEALASARAPSPFRRDHRAK
jgi:tetratricopeptide (TPR) repeat protein